MTQDQKLAVDSLKPTETWRIMKNVVVISLAFMVHFTAYSGAANLQSSINAEAGLGTASLAAVYAGLIFSNIFLPVIMIKWLGTKWAISLSFITYMPYIAAQLYPTFYTMIPAGLIVGLGGGPLWCAKCTYLSVVSEAHSRISKISAEALLVRFLGLFFMIFQMNQVWGNLISSLVLTSGNNTAAVTSLNETMIPILCGPNFLPSTDAGGALPTQPPEKIQMLSGIYLACMAGAALIVAIGVDSMKRYDPGRQGSGSGISGMALLAVTLKLMAEPTQLLLITINIFIGLQQAFFGADFTAAFVSCSVGTGSVGFVMMTFGLADAIGCVLTGYLAKLTGRLPLICGAAIGHAALFTFLLTWRPLAGETYILYIIAVLWGLCDSVWLVQINAYYGVLFPGREEAAFSNFRLWESVGYIIAYILSPYLRTTHKTYLLLATMIGGILCYFIVEYQQFQIKKEEERKKDLCYVKGCDNIAFQTVIWLNTKWAVCFSLITYMPYIACQMYPSFYTLVPAAFLTGLGAGPLWCAKCTYLSMTAEVNSTVFGIPAGTLLQRFLGFFFMVFHMCNIWGNLISSLVLSTGNNASTTSVNATMIPQICGANFLASSDAAEALPAQPPEKIQMIAGIYLAFMVGSFLIVAVGLDSMKRYEACRNSASSRLSGFALLAVTVKHLSDPNQLLLLAINIFIGHHQAFIGADYTASFVSCAIGTGSVGYVMMAFGLSDAISCFVTGYLAKLYGRLPLIFSAMIIHGGLLLTLLLWRPQSTDYYIIFIIAILWGFCDSVWTVQINAYYGVLFRGREEAAFSNYRLWEGCGYITSYVLSSYVRTRYKIYLLLANLVIGVMGYFTVEYRQSRSESKTEKKDDLDK